MYAISREQGVTATVVLASAAALGATGSQAGPMTYSWTDIFIGVEPEYGVSNNKFNHPVIHGSSTSDFAGMGITGGANYQFMRVWVAGVQGFYDWNVASGAPEFVNGVTVRSESNWQAGVQGRLGFLVVPQVMVYGTGGFQWRNEEIFLGAGFSQTVGQAFWGGGVEYALSPRYHVDLQVTASQNSNTALFFGDLPGTFHDVTAKVGFHASLWKK